MAKKKGGKKGGKQKGEAAKAPKKVRKGAGAKGVADAGSATPQASAPEAVTREDLLVFLEYIQTWVQIVHDSLASPQEDGRFRSALPADLPRIVIRSSPDRPC